MNKPAPADPAGKNTTPHGDCRPRPIAVHPQGGVIGAVFDCAACRAKVGILPHVPRTIPNIPGC